MSPWIVRIRTLFLLTLLAVGVGAPPLTAQATGRVTGQVVAAGTLGPVASAQVFLPGLQMGELTNEDGRFLLLNVPVGTHVVRVEVLGYATASQSVNVTAGGTAVVNFQLNETAIALEELVVTGTATEVRAREVGNSLDALTSMEFEHLAVSNPEAILSGRIPGLSVLTGTGQPGTGAAIRIRGQVTASQTAEPLIYVDGIRVFNLPVSSGSEAGAGIYPLQDINADDVERIEVVKGAAATTLYGTEASAGVIQIFTKRGVVGAPIWSGEMSLGMNQQGHLGPSSDPTQVYTQCNRSDLFTISQSSSSFGERERFVDPTCPSDGSWFRNGAIARYNLSVRGGAGDVRYYVSGFYNNNDGSLPTANSKDGGIRGNFDFSPTAGLNVALNTAYTRRQSRFIEDGNRANGFLLNINRGTAGNFKGGKGDDCANVAAEFVCVTNRYVLEQENTNSSDRFTTGLTFQYEPISNLSNRLSIGWDFNRNVNEQQTPFGAIRSSGGSYDIDNLQRTKLALDYAGSYRRSFGSDFVTTSSWGGQLFQDRTRLIRENTSVFAGPGEASLESGALRDPPSDASLSVTTAGVFLQEVIGYKDRLFLTAGLRVDGNSAFGDDFGLQSYPKVSVAYVISDESFWPTGIFETFKIRGAMGESGKAPGAFDKLRTWQPLNGIPGVPGFTPNDVGNSDVGPERTREYEVGFDASLLRGRVALEATYFNARTTDALVNETLPSSLGFLSTRTVNAGELKSEGVEFQLSSTLLRNSWIEWSGRANIAFNRTEAVDLSGQEIFADNKAEFREGHAVATYFGAVVTNPDEFAAPIIVEDTAIGPTNPTRLYGFSTQVRLGDRLVLDGLLEHQGGHYLLNYTRYQNSRRGAWQPCFAVQEKMVAFLAGQTDALNDVTARDRAHCRMRSSRATGTFGSPDSDLFIERANFWKLRNVSVTYEVPTHLIQSFASRARVTLSGNNLATWTPYTGFDPESEDFSDRAEDGIFDGNGDYGKRDYYQIPSPRTWLLSVRLTF